ncbi:MAG TPA: Imm26 family immunity protein [Candidatus Saccharimonadales bacterium]|nr:Imm26 family immunity protein [Candidatus Saccharimonadales bacterium]
MNYLKESRQIPEGTWFIVPLGDDKFATGVVARRDSRNARPIMFGYFFKPVGAAPQLDKIKELSPAHTTLAARFSYLGLVGGKWPIIERDRTWNRSDWPMIVRRVLEP